MSTPTPSAKPRAKVVAATVGAGVGAALATIATWIVEASAAIDVPESVELALGVVLTAGIAFASGYIKSD